MDEDSGEPAWTYERVFNFAFPVERAWALFTDPVETRAWLLPFESNEDGKLEATIEGQSPVTFAVLEVLPLRRLRTTMSGGNIPGRLETTTRFDRTDAGSTATMTHRGFGEHDAWERFGGSFACGWDEAATDLLVYVRTGVKLPRHIADLRASIAAWPVQRDWGVELAEVFPGGFAEKAGMRAGDILLGLDRMGVYRIADVWAFTRARPAGEMVEAKFIHGGEPRRGSAALNRFEDFGE